MADVSAGEKLKVFISYSRKDSAAFADELVAGLEFGGFAPFLDRHDIAAGEDWEARLGGLIAQSDTVVFVISPEAVKSEQCTWEVDRTIELSRGSCRLSSSRFPITTSPKNLGGCNSCPSTAGQDLRGRCRSSPRHCGWTLIGFASTPGSGTSRGDGTHAGARNRCFCAATTSTQQKHGWLPARRRRPRSPMPSAPSSGPAMRPRPRGLAGSAHN